MRIQCVSVVCQLLRYLWFYERKIGTLSSCQQDAVLGGMRMTPLRNMRTDFFLTRAHTHWRQIIQQALELIRRIPSCISAPHLWVTVFGQHLQHRRFSALNVSHEHEFTPHNQRLRVSSFLHGCCFFFNVCWFLGVFASLSLEEKERSGERAQQCDREGAEGENEGRGNRPGALRPRAAPAGCALLI